MVDNNDSSGQGAGKVDFTAAKQFLALWGTSWTFQTYDDHKIKGVPKRPWLQRILHANRANLEVVLQELARLNAAGAAVCVTINQTDGLGRERKNIVAVNALFIDLDSGANSAPLSVVRAYKLPHGVMESSPGGSIATGW